MIDTRQAELLERLVNLQPAVVCDVLDVMNYPHQTLSSRLRLVDPKSKIAGPAFCVRGSTNVGAGIPAPASGSKPVFEMDRHLYPGCIVVAETGANDQGAVFGGNVGLSFKMRGCHGVIVDGGIRDTDEYIEMGLPVAPMFTTPMSFKGLFDWTAIEVPVRIPGQVVRTVVVHPGDLLLGDIDGLVAIPQDIAPQVVAHAEVTGEMEARIKADLAKGEDREAVYRRHDRFGHIRKG